MPTSPTAKKSDLADGQMKRITVGQTDVLLVRVGDAFLAIADHSDSDANSMVSTD